MKANRATKVARLEEALCMWEEHMWANSLLRQAAERVDNTYALERTLPLTGPVKHYRELRRHLLSIRSRAEFDKERFIRPVTEEKTASVQDKDRDYNKYDVAAGDGPTQVLPGQLAAWMTASRRVFRLDPDLQALLGATSLKDVTLSDVRLPFESFALALDEPIRCPFTGREFDLLLFSTLSVMEEGVTEWAVTLFNRELQDWRPLASRAALEKKFRRGRYEEVGAELHRLNAHQRHLRMLSMHIVRGDSQVAITEMLDFMEELPKQEGVAARTAWQLIIGLAMYLRMLPADSPHRGSWTKADPDERLLGSLDHRAITDESEICTVTSLRRLSPEERTAFLDYASGRGGYEVSAHFRIGYWHRPRGFGDDPTHPKTEWTNPTLVRRDRLPEGAVPGGSEVTVT